MRVVTAKEQAIEPVSVIENLAGNTLALIFQLLHKAVDDPHDISMDQPVSANPLGIGPC